MENKEQGIIGKYKIERTDGTPMEPLNEYFVLKLAGKGSKEHIMACRKAIHVYAKDIEHKHPKLAKELVERYPY